MPILGRRLKYLRKAMGLTMIQLERKTGVDASHISRLETGKLTNPTAAVLTRLADGLDTSVDYLLGRDPHWTRGALDLQLAALLQALGMGEVQANDLVRALSWALRLAKRGVEEEELVGGKTRSPSRDVLESVRWQK